MPEEQAVWSPLRVPAEARGKIRTVQRMERKIRDFIRACGGLEKKSFLVCFFFF